VTQVTDDDAKRISDAIADQNSEAYSSPSGPMLTLMSAFAREGKFEEFALAALEHRRKFPANAAHINYLAAAKILNGLGEKHHSKISALKRLEEEFAGWAGELRSHLDNPFQFQAVVERMDAILAKD
jgi:hypothetical protein